MDGADWFTLEELAGRLGGLAWVEEQLASLLADWSRLESHASVAIGFAVAGRHHRWHGEIIRGCLPTSPQLNAAGLVQAPTAGWAASMRTLNELTDPDATSARLRALVKVMQPWIDREIGALTELARPASDAPMLRWLRFVSIDHDEDARVFADFLGARSSEPARFGDHATLHELDLR